MSSSTRQQRLNRKNAVAEVASRYFHHGTRQIWDALVLIALGKFTEPTRRPEVRYMSDGQILPTEEGNRRRMWDFLATRFNDASPKEPFDAKAAERILREWSNLVRGCSEVHQYRTRDLFRPTWEEWREVADQMDRAKKNPAPVAGAVIAAVAQALLPAVMKAGSNQIEAYKRADMNGKVKLLKKWSVYTLNIQLRLLLQHKPTARRVARDLDKLLKNKKALKQIETAGRVGLEAGKAYKGAKAKKNPKKGGEWYSNFSEEELRYEIEDLEEKLADSYRAASRRGPDRLDWSHELDDWLADTHTDLADLRRELKRQEAMAKKNGPTRERPHYPFAEKEKQYSRYTTEALYHAMNDAMAASRAQEGWNEAGANWYLDDYHTIVKEIQRRKGRG